MIRFPPRRILVPFDFTEVSQAAWRQAVWLAGRCGASLDAVYTEDLLPSGVLGFGSSRLTPGLRREIRSHLRGRVGDGARLHVSQGDPAVVILRLARTLHPDLIVMGTHGRQGFERLRLGSVAEAVARVSPVPVLTLREFSGPIRSILALDAGGGLSFAEDVAAALQARLKVLPLDARRPPEAVLRAAKDHELLIVGSGRSSIRELLTGTAAERLLRASTIPVLTVPSGPHLPAAGATAGKNQTGLSA